MDIVIAILLGAAGSLIAAELYANASKFARWLIRWAAKNVPHERQARYEEEWQAHLCECTGNLCKIWHALGCVYCAFRFSRPYFRNSRENVARWLIGLSLRQAEWSIALLREAAQVHNAGQATAEQIAELTEEIERSWSILRSGHHYLPDRAPLFERFKS